MIFWLATIFICFSIVLIMIFKLYCPAMIVTHSVRRERDYQVYICGIFIFICLNFGFYALLGSPGLNMSDVDARQFVKLAVAQFAEQHYKEAADNYSKALQHGIITAPLLVGYVVAQTATKTDFTISEENMLLLKKAVELAPNDMYPVLYLALGWHQRGKNKEAVGVLQNFLHRARLNKIEIGKLQKLIAQYEGA